MREEEYSTSPGPSADVHSGDTWTDTGLDAQYVDDDTLRIGKDVKASGVYDEDSTYLVFDTNIPSGANIIKAKLTVTPVATEADDAVCEVHTLEPSGSVPQLKYWAEDDKTDPAIQLMPIVTYVKDTAAATLGNAGNTNRVELFIGKGNLATGVAQKMQIVTAGNGTLGSVSMEIEANGDVDGGIIWYEIWNVSGTDGFYKPGDTLLASSDNLVWNDVTYTANEATFSGDNQIATAALLSGDCVVVARTNVELSETLYLGTFWDDEIPIGDHNAIIFGEFGGFSEIFYPRREDLEAIPRVSPSEGTITLPAATADTPSTMGSSDYSPNLTTTTIEDVVKEAVAYSGYAGRIGFFLEGKGAGEIDVHRVWHSGDAAGQDGPQLTVAWDEAGNIRGEPSIAAAISAAAAVSASIDASLSISPAVSGKIGILQ